MQDKKGVYSKKRLFNTLQGVLKRQAPGEYKNDYLADVTSWGFEQDNRNNFPQQLLQDVQDSPVAFACLEVWSEFLFGEGLNKEVSVLPANSFESVNELYEKCSQDVASLEGFCVHVGYNIEGQKTSITHQPFEQTRLKCLPNGTVKEIKTNPFFGIENQFDQKYTKTFYPYNPDPAFVRNQIAEHNEKLISGKVNYPYPGQIFWTSIERPLSRIYPKPFYYAGVNWFRIDAEIQKFHERNLDNNFLLGHVLNIYGDPDQPVGQDDDKGDGKTLGELVQDKLKNFGSGAKNGGGQWINFYLSEDEKLKPEPFSTNANDELFNTLQELTTSQIAISFNVPTILVGIQQEGRLGNTQEMINSIKLMQARARRKKVFLAKNLERVFRGKYDLSVEDWTSKDTNLIDLLPDWVIRSNALTQDEIRGYIKKNFNIELEEKNNGADSNI